MSTNSNSSSSNNNSTVVVIDKGYNRTQTTEPVTSNGYTKEENVSVQAQQAAVAPQKNERVRIFVALFDYDPPTMSPNPDACDEELPFREGQLIKVNRI